jgi:acetoin utilization protein AcuB
MLVGERMSSPPHTIPPTMPINEALSMMKSKRIRRAPVVKDGKMVGIISETDLLNASPSQATSLSVWELNYLISKILVRDVMTSNVLTVSEDTPIEIAARIMVDNRIGGLPVMRGDELVGIITETDLFKIFLELMGAREVGVRVTALAPERKGELAELTRVISNAGGNFIAFGVFEGDSPANRLVTFKVVGMSMEEIRRLVEPVVEKLVDIRRC